jgi:hypothetical protein
MSKYLKIAIEENETGNIAEAWIGKSLNINLLAGTARLMEAGYKTHQAILDHKREAVNALIWDEPDISILVTSTELPADTKIEDIVYQAIVDRMVTLDSLPGTDTPNPFKGATVEDI